jgi:hypothetical protein
MVQKEKKETKPDYQLQPGVEYVWMRRRTDGDGPHPIHPDEVKNYVSGEWEVVEQQ